MCAALAVSAAVVRQRATGMGDVIDVSLLDSDLAVMAPRIASHLAGEPEPAPSDGTDSVLAVYQRFPTADRDIVIAIGNDAMWRRFCAAAGLPDLAAEPELADNAGRREHRARLIKTITDALSGRDAEDWLGVLEAAGVPVSLVKGLSEVASDPHVRARNALMEVPGSGGGLFSVHSPFRLASIPAPRNERFPDLGADTAAVLAEYGFVQSEIDRLISNGAVHDTAARPEEDA
jgi:crotonobetainyl-CoA:carnitine CoA-transferase CaiB-like acyl-CoA transferase